MQPSIVAVRIVRSDLVTVSSSSAVDWITLTVTMSSEYPQTAPAVSVSGDSLHRHVAAELSVALTVAAQQLVGQPMILDK